MDKIFELMNEKKKYDKREQNGERLFYYD